MTSAREALGAIWTTAGADPELLGHVSLTDAGPVLPSTFAVDAMAQATIAASGLAAAALWRDRTGRMQRVAVNPRHAAAEFRSERYLQVEGYAPRIWDKIAGLYQTGDGRWVRLHTNLPHHRSGMLALLGCDYDRESVQRALDRWEGEAFETAVAEAGIVAAMARTPDEWAAHPHGQAVARLPIFSIEKIGEAPPRSWPASDRPLAGIRVLDMTRIIAGPVCGRTLAAHGAEVLLITSPRLPSVEVLVMDSGRGKRAAFLDLTDASARDTAKGLVEGADIFVQGYRPGAIAGKGLSAEQCAEFSPGVVCVSLSAYGHEGPWSWRRGFDSLVQTANGINLAEAAALGETKPKELPAQALDHGSGYLMATGAMLALARQRREGGSWHVRVSLAQTGHWLSTLERMPKGLDIPDQDRGEIADLLEESQSGFGRMRAIRHAAVLSETPARFDLPSMPLGSHEARWQ